MYMELFHDDEDLPTTTECTSYFFTRVYVVADKGGACRKERKEEVRDNHLVKT